MLVMKNKKWIRDELLLTLAFYHEHFPRIPDTHSKEIRSLSETLRKIQVLLQNNIDAKTRNPNGVYMKLMNFNHINPQHHGKGLESVSKLDQEIFNEFIGKENQLSVISKKINEVVNSTNLDTLRQDFNHEDDEYEGKEGMVLFKIHKIRERAPKIVKKKKAEVLKQKGSLECEGCKFNFYNYYGDRGEGFIECHHTKPVSAIQENESTKLVDLILLCSNCHRMVHRKRPWLNLRELTELISENHKIR